MIQKHNPRAVTLYLDYDGVLHPDEVYRIGGKIVLKMDGMNLFEWAGVLEELLEPYPDLAVVLATSWVRTLGFEEARSWLPVGLQRRVVGATWNSHAPRNWERLTRYEQIRRDVERHRRKHWFAIDDDGTGWAEEHRAHLVLTDSLLGVGVASVQRELRERLESLHR